MISFSKYQEEAKKAAIFPKIDGVGWIYPALGLAGEAGEVVEQIKKMIRDDNLEPTLERLAKVSKELGDVLWYAAMLCEELGLDLGHIAEMNLYKIRERVEAGTLQGDGSDR
jgi:NTP pyrophosphatase (non-canonical NTP hydrolase)